ncbi:MAG: hypothetical protein ACO394_11575 [Blastocatellia bacterium]
MSEKHDHQSHDHLKPESSSIQAKPVYIFLGVLAVASAFVFVLIYGLLWALDRQREADQTPPATRVTMPEGMKKYPPEPRLQGAPAPEGPSLLPLDDWVDYKKKMDAAATSYAWVDENSGIARIPLERAKEIVAQEGLPLLSETAQQQIELAEATRLKVLGAEASGGRIIR